MFLPRKGWFPFSYTQPFPNTPGQQDIRSIDVPLTFMLKWTAKSDHLPIISFCFQISPPPLSKMNSTSMGQLDRLPPCGHIQQASPDSEEERNVVSQRVSTFRPRPYSMLNPETTKMSPRLAGQRLKDRVSKMILGTSVIVFPAIMHQMKLCFPPYRCPMISSALLRLQPGIVSQIWLKVDCHHLHYVCEN